MGAGILTRIARIDTDKKLLIARRESVEIREIRVSPGEIEIRAAHEIMAARTAQLALLVDQLMSALRAKPPVLAGNVFVRRCGTRVVCGWIQRFNFSSTIHKQTIAPKDGEAFHV